MNDDELKERLAKLRVPPCNAAAQRTALNRALGALGRCEEKQTRWTWRDWLWPSPLAWGALASIWIVALASSPRTPPGGAAVTAMPAQPLSPFFARSEYQELLRQFPQPPASR